MTLNRRQAIGLGTGALAGMVLGCAGGWRLKRAPRRPVPGVAKVRRLAELLTVRVPCDTYFHLWRGPQDAVVHVTLTGGEACAAVVALTPTGGYANPAPDVPDANPGQTVEVRLAVPQDHHLGVQCAGPSGQGDCVAVVTGVDPVLPQGVTMGTTEIVQPAGSVTDPNTAPAPGTPVLVSCGKTSPLWEGPSSFVTVRVRGSANCRARIYPDGEDMASHTHDSQDPAIVTFGPVVALTGRCRGNQGSTPACEFQVVEVIELPA